MTTDVILIGPIGAGKSTLAELLSRRLGLPNYKLDELRWSYYAEIGYDEQLANTRYAEGGFPALCQYWKPFEVHAVKRVLSEHSDCVIDFGAGHSVYEDDRQFEQVSKALEPYPSVALVLPSPDPEESIRTLSLRNPNVPEHEREENRLLNEHFVRHHSNTSLAKFVVYTNGKTPEESCDEILSWMRSDERAHPSAPESGAPAIIPNQEQPAGHTVERGEETGPLPPAPTPSAPNTSRSPDSSGSGIEEPLRTDDRLILPPDHGELSPGITAATMGFPDSTQNAISHPGSGAAASRPDPNIHAREQLHLDDEPGR